VDIKTIISLRKKINNLSFNLNNFNFIENCIMFFLAFLFAGTLLLTIVLGLKDLSNNNYIHGFLTLFFTIISVPFFKWIYPLIHKRMLKNKSTLFQFLFSHLFEGIRFKSFKYIDETLKSLTKEEEELLHEIRTIKKQEKISIHEILENKILTYSKTANQKEFDFILDSVEDKQLRLSILENSQKNKKQESNIVKQKIIKSI